MPSRTRSYMDLSRLLSIGSLHNLLPVAAKTALTTASFALGRVWVSGALNRRALTHLCINGAKLSPFQQSRPRRARYSLRIPIISQMTRPHAQGGRSHAATTDRATRTAAIEARR